MTVALATVQHDPRGELTEKLRANLPGLLEVFDAGIGVMASQVADEEGIRLLVDAGAIVERDSGPPGIDTIGLRRRECLGVALRTGATHVLHADVDHAMRWLERGRDDPVDALAVLPDADFTIIGRPPEVFAEAPASLRETEGLCNRFYEHLTGRPWELFIAVRGMSRETAQLIVDECDEDTIATDVAWPLFVESRGCSIAYREAHLHYENHRWFASGESEKERIERDPRSWSLRFHLAKQMMDAFARWGPYEAAHSSSRRSRATPP